MAVPYRGKIYWVWGDTSQPRYPLGLFRTSGATSQLPGKGGLRAGVGVDLTYFVGADGFSRAMAPLPESPDGPVWIDGLLTVNDETGRERMLCTYSRIKPPFQRVERGLMAYNDKEDIFEKIMSVPLDAPLAPAGHPLRATSEGQDYFYFPNPYPASRVKADWKSLHDLSAYEGYTCLAQGTRYENGNTKLERDAGGRLVFQWKRDTPPLTLDQQKELIADGKMTRHRDDRRP